MTDRPLRICDVCEREDDHPRHVHGAADGGTQTRHMDCCHEAGCPDGTCDSIVAASGGKTGDALLAYITEEN